MKIGKVSINVEASKDITKDEFFALVKGNITIDKEVAWKQFQNEAKQYASSDKPSKTSAKP